MKRGVAVGVASVACLAFAASTGESQIDRAAVSAYLASYYTMAPLPKQVTISDTSGRILSVLEVPPDVAISLHLARGESPASFKKGEPVTFAGDVTIRTRPRSELVDGALRPQMMDAAFRLDVNDVVVVLVLKR